jgi:hypothetical protein
MRICALHYEKGIASNSTAYAELNSWFLVCILTFTYFELELVRVSGTGPRLTTSAQHEFGRVAAMLFPEGKDLRYRFPVQSQSIVDWGYLGLSYNNSRYTVICKSLPKRSI